MVYGLHCTRHCIDDDPSSSSTEKVIREIVRVRFICHLFLAEGASPEFARENISHNVQTASIPGNSSEELQSIKQAGFLSALQRSAVPYLLFMFMSLGTALVLGGVLCLLWKALRHFLVKTSLSIVPGPQVESQLTGTLPVLLIHF